MLRHGDREVAVEPGDFIVYWPGEPAPYTFVSDGSEPLEYIATGNRGSYEVCEYLQDRIVYVEVLDRIEWNDEVAGTREAIES